MKGRHDGEVFFLKAEMRCNGSNAGVFIGVGSISVIEPTVNGLKVKLSNAEGDYYVKDGTTYTIDNIIDLYRRNR